MNPMLKVSAAVLIAAMSVVPATGVFAATAVASASPMMVVGAKADAVPLATLKAMIGKWKAGDLASIDSAKSVKVIDTKTLYTPADLKTLDAARTASAADLTKFHAAINADAGFKSWLAKNKIDVGNVIGISAAKGSPEVFVY